MTKCFRCGEQADLELLTSFRALSLKGTGVLKKNPALGKTPMPTCMGCLEAMGTEELRKHAKKIVQQEDRK